MTVTMEIAKVYRGGRRRYFTLKAALFAEARAEVLARCTCEHYTPVEGDGGYFPETCPYHELVDGKLYWQVVAERLVRMRKLAMRRGRS